LAINNDTAVILEDGDLSFDMAQSEERMSSKSIKEKMRFVTLSHDPSQEREPRAESALVEVVLKNGYREQVFVEHVLGFPERPMNRHDVEEKARSLTVPLLGSEQSKALIKIIWDLENLRDIRDITPLLIPAENTSSKKIA